MPLPDDVRRALSEAHQEALRVGDSPLRADRLADRLPALAQAVDAAAEESDDVRARVRAALEHAARVLRRDDAGREAARHLEAALRLAGGPPRPRTPSPFADDD